MNFMGHYVEWRENRVRQIIRHYGEKWFEGKRVLEVGAGGGHIGARLAALGADVTCVEGRKENVEQIAREHPNVRAILLNLENEWVDGEYDLVLNMGLIYHLSDVDFNLRRTFETAEHVVLETETLDSLSDRVERIEEDARGYDQSLIGKGSRPSQAYVERKITEFGHKYERFFSSELNSGAHIYDWNISDTGTWAHGRRRFWFTKRVKRDGTSVVVQGPMNAERLEKVLRYAGDVDELIVSCYDTDLGNDVTVDKENVKVIRSPVPVTRDRSNQQNIYLQAYSSLRGVMESEYGKVIKTRSDEFISRMQPLSELRLEPERVYCSNIYVRTPLHIKYAMSDHLIVADRSVMLRAFEKLLSWLDMSDESVKKMRLQIFDQPPPLFFDVNGSYTCAEVVMFIAFVTAIRGDMRNLTPIDATKKFLKIIDRNEIGLISEKGFIHDDPSDLMSQRNIDNLPTGGTG